MQEEGAVRHARCGSRSMQRGISRAADMAPDGAGAARASLGLVVLPARPAKEDGSESGTTLNLSFGCDWRKVDGCAQLGVAWKSDVSSVRSSREEATAVLRCSVEDS